MLIVQEYLSNFIYLRYRPTSRLIDDDFFHFLGFLPLNIKISLHTAGYIIFWITQREWRSPTTHGRVHRPERTMRSPSCEQKWIDTRRFENISKSRGEWTRPFNWLSGKLNRYSGTENASKITCRVTLVNMPVRVLVKKFRTPSAHHDSTSFYRRRLSSDKISFSRKVSKFVKKDFKAFSVRTR